MGTKPAISLISIFFAILLLFTKRGTGLALLQARSRAFVRIDLPLPQDIRQLASLGTPLHKQIQKQFGEISWLTFLTASQILSWKPRSSR